MSMLVEQKSAQELCTFKGEESGINLGVNKIELYFSTKYTYSAILMHINSNFNSLHRLPEMTNLHLEHLRLLFKHDSLEVINEDQVFSAFCSWYSTKAYSIEQVLPILESIRWRFVSFPTLHANVTEDERL